METVRMAGRGLVVALSTAVLLPFVAGTGNAATAPQEKSVGVHSQTAAVSDGGTVRGVRDGRCIRDRWHHRWDHRWHRRPSHGIGIGIGLGLRIGLGIGIGVGIGDSDDDGDDGDGRGAGITT